MPTSTSLRRAAPLLCLALLAAPARAQEQAPPRLPPLQDERGDPGPVVTRIELRDASVADAARLVAEVAGWNVVCTPEAGAYPVTVLIQGVPVRTALETLCKVTGLWYREDAGILRIMTAEQYRDDVVVRREAQTKVFTLLHPNAPSIAQAISDLYGGRVRISFGINDQFYLSQLAGGGGFGNNGGFGGVGNGGLGNGVGNVLGGSGSGAFSTNLGGFGGGFGNGGFGSGGFGNGGLGDGAFGNGALGNGAFGNGNGSNGGGLNFERELARLDQRVTADQLSRLQVRDGQATGTESDEIAQGLPPVYVTVNRRNNLISVRTSDDRILGEIEALIVQLDRATPQVLLELKILEVQLSDGLNTAVDFSWLEDPVRANPADGLAPNPLTGTAPALTNILGAGSGSILPGSQLVYQYLNDHVRVRIQALGAEGRLTALATPLLMCANSEISRIFIGEERPLVRSVTAQTVTSVAGTNTVLVPQTELRDIGNSLRIVPLINADRTVSLTIIQDISSLNPGAATTFVPTDTGGVEEVPIDTVSTTNLQGTVVAKDGLTLVVGGLIRKSYSDTRAGVPYLMDLPLVGWLFGSEDRDERQTEVILLITPHILTTPEEAEARSKARMEALSLHPYHDLGDAAVNRYDRSDVPGSADYRLLLEDYLLGAPEPIR